MSIDVQNTINNGCKIALEMAASAGVGYLLAHAVHVINPSTAAVFCAVIVPVSLAVDVLSQKIFAQPGATSEAKFVGRVISIIIASAVSGFIATALGFAIPFTASLVMSLALITSFTVLRILGLVESSHSNRSFSPIT